MHTIEITMDDATAVPELAGFLRGASLTGTRIGTGTAPPPPGQLGTMETVTVLLTSGTAVALARALDTWVRSRKRSVRLHVTRPEDGGSFDFEASGPETFTALERFLDGDPLDQ